MKLVDHCLNMMLLISTLVLSLLAISDGQGDAQFHSAFSVVLTHHLSLTGGETILYDKVFTNIGNNYNPTTGVFTAPQNGIYVFQFHGLSRSDQEMYLELYEGSNIVASAYAYAQSDWCAAGNNAILHLKKGDTVRVKNANGYASQLYGDVGEFYCTFSGYLISPYFEEAVVVG